MFSCVRVFVFSFISFIILFHFRLFFITHTICVRVIISCFCRLVSLRSFFSMFSVHGQLLSVPFSLSPPVFLLICVHSYSPLPRPFSIVESFRVYCFFVFLTSSLRRFDAFSGLLRDRPATVLPRCSSIPLRLVDKLVPGEIRER